MCIRDSNTTYALNFGSAVRDNNEGNPLYSMRYVFSTGPTIDSMIFSGYTADSYKADSVSKSFIWFFPADSVENVAEYDSTIFKYKPAVIARAENNGIFIAQNLKPIPYRVYAVQDKNDNQMYEPGSDQVGFLEKSYNPAEMPDFATVSYTHLDVYKRQVILRVGVSHAYFGFEVPVPAEYPSVSVGDAGAYEPALIAVVRKFREIGTQERDSVFHASDVVLPSVCVETYEMSCETVAEP